MHVAPGPPVAPMLAPRRALAQGVANLVRNGLDATAPAGTVTLGMETSADGVRLVVRDDGAGMSPDVLARAAEPFFSTKPAGAGMGLGLFLAQRSPKGSAARSRSSRRPGGGTRAVIEIPRSHGARGSSPSRMTSPRSILIVDDDAVFRRAWRTHSAIAAGRCPRRRTATRRTRGARRTRRSTPSSTSGCPDGSGLERRAAAEGDRSGDGDRRAHGLRKHRDGARRDPARRDALPDEARRCRRHPGRRSRAASGARRGRRRGARGPVAGACRVGAHQPRARGLRVGTFPRPRGVLGLHRRSLQRKLSKYPSRR